LVEETEVLGENLPSATFVHHKIPHEQTWVWTRAAAVGSRRLTAWAIARPFTALTDAGYKVHNVALSWEEIVTLSSSVCFLCFLLFGINRISLNSTKKTQQKKKKANREKIEPMRSVLFIGTAKQRGQLLWGKSRDVSCGLNKYFPFRSTQLPSQKWGIYYWSSSVNMPSYISFSVKLSVATVL
jgi:hypothetical protein